MNSLKYVICHNGMYIQESENFGEFNRTKQIGQAFEFTDMEMLKRYIENELRLNLANVSIVELKTVTTITNLILFNGTYVNRDTVEYCAQCDKLHLVNAMMYHKANNVDKPQLYCTKCFDELDSKNHNVIGNQQFDEVE